ncbi:MAG: hypothetical protein ACJA2N_002134 [Salibacteraceae bacterium]|jgi:hypothetical protein
MSEKYLKMKFSNSNKVIHSLITLVILTGISSVGFSQVSGFLGKKLIIGVEVSSMVKFNLLSDFDYKYGTYNASGNFVQGPEYSQVNLRYRPTIRLEYVISRKNSIQGIVRIFNPMVDAPNYIVGQPTSWGATEEFVYKPKDRVKMKTINFGLNYKWYMGDALSPVGVFMTLGFEYSQIKFDLEEDSFSNNDSRYNSSSRITYGNPVPEKTSIIILTYGLGKQYALSNMVLMNVGMEFGLPLRLSKKEPEYEMDEWADKTAAVETRLHSLISVVLGFSLAL